MNSTIQKFGSNQSSHLHRTRIPAKGYGLYLIRLPESPANDNCHKCILLPTTKLGQGYIFTGVCHSVNKRWWYEADTPKEQTCPQSRHLPGLCTYPTGSSQPPPRADTPRGPGTPAGSRTHPGGDTPQSRHLPLGLNTPPGTKYTPPPEIRSTRGRYASYWNANLFNNDNNNNLLLNTTCTLVRTFYIKERR